MKLQERKMDDELLIIEDKLNSLSEEELKLHRYIRELSPSELLLINRLIETGLKVNRSLK